MLSAVSKGAHSVLCQTNRKFKGVALFVFSFLFLFPPLSPDRETDAVTTSPPIGGETQSHLFVSR